MADNKRPWSPPQMIWGAIGGIALWSAVGFSWFGTGFNWKTQGGAQQLSTNAVVESMASICVAQARDAPGAEAALKQFAALESWKQRSFIEEAKWSNMPGSDSSESGVAEACATKLRAT